MKKDKSILSLSKQTAAKTIFATFKILKAAGGQLPGREVIQKIRQTIKFTEWENTIYETTGYVRWESILHFYTIDCIKAGFIRKDKRVWYLTVEGEKAISLGEIKLLETVSKAYKQWVVKGKDGNPITSTEQEKEITELEENPTRIQKASIELLEEQAIAGIKNFINKKNPYEFQELVATLLRAMKYYTPYISPKGRDGGLDIVAYQDPLGATTPRIKVQVKHRPDSKTPPDDIRSLVGLLNKDGDVGLFVTSGGFTNEAERFARDSHIHIKLIDIDTFITLWQEHYKELNDDEKNLLPLHSIYFLGSNE